MGDLYKGCIVHSFKKKSRLFQETQEVVVCCVVLS